jgi:hypothetical protein
MRRASRIRGVMFRIVAQLGWLLRPGIMVLSVGYRKGHRACGLRRTRDRACYRGRISQATIPSTLTLAHERSPSITSRDSLKSGLGVVRSTA